MQDFRNYISSLNVRQLQEHTNILNRELISRQAVLASRSCDNKRDSTCLSISKTVNDFVEYRESFIESTDRDLLYAECESLKFNK